MVIFCLLHVIKVTHEYALRIISSVNFTFIVEGSWKDIHFHSQKAWPPATYDVISRNDSNWSSVNLSQNAQ